MNPTPHRQDDDGLIGNAYAAWYPRVVVAAGLLVKRIGLVSPARNSAMLLLIKRGCEGAQRHLRTYQDEYAEAWSRLSEAQRADVAMRPAIRAMVAHVRRDILPSLRGNDECGAASGWSRCSIADR